MSNKWDRANCMGYALGVNEWLTPNGEDYLLPDEMVSENFSKLVENISKNFGLVQIPKEQVDKIQGEVIAFRLEEESDFHFMVRKGRNWFHKRGSLDQIYRMKKAEVMGESWCQSYGRSYCGEIAFFVESAE